MEEKQGNIKTDQLEFYHECCAEFEKRYDKAKILSLEIYDSDSPPFFNISGDDWMILSVLEHTETKEIFTTYVYITKQFREDGDTGAIFDVLTKLMTEGFPE